MAYLSNDVKGLVFTRTGGLKVRASLQFSQANIHKPTLHPSTVLSIKSSQAIPPKLLIFRTHFPRMSLLKALPRKALPLARTRMFTTSPFVSRSVVEGTTDALKAADRKLSDAAVKAIEKGGQFPSTYLRETALNLGKYRADPFVQKLQQKLSNLRLVALPTRPRDPQVRCPTRPKDQQVRFLATPRVKHMS